MIIDVLQHDQTLGIGEEVLHRRQRLAVEGSEDTAVYVVARHILQNVGSRAVQWRGRAVRCGGQMAVLFHPLAIQQQRTHPVARTMCSIHGQVPLGDE
nr:hypothetical protein [Haloglycomyces albus]